MKRRRVSILIAFGVLALFVAQAAPPLALPLAPSRTARDGAPAAAPTPSCGVGGTPCPVSGDFSPLSVSPPITGTWVSAPGAPAFGALIYDPDFKNIEREARAKLEAGLGIREVLSPYRGNLEFAEYVKKFDAHAGWQQPITHTASVYNGRTLQELVDDADRNLRQARDLYAYLLVYAPEHRFRADPEYIQVL